MLKPASCSSPVAQRGFTLLEILVALAIVSLALGALISSSGSQARNATYLKQKTIAHWVAMNEITRLEVEKAWPGKGKLEGKTSMAGVDWFWTRQIIETEDKDSVQVELTVFNSEQRESNLTRLTGYLSNPNALANTSPAQVRP